MQKIVLGESAKKTTYEEYLAQNGSLTYTFRGVSMNPMLKQGRDLFTVVKKTDERCKKYDVILYRRGKQYVLHRIVDVVEGGYVLLGDNCISKEYGIKEEDVLGVMTEFVRNGKIYSANHKGYRVYAKLWYALYPIRRVWKRCILKMKHMIKGMM